MLPAVRALGGPEVATRAAYDAGEESWAASLQQATAELAAEGVHLDQAGVVTAERPETLWNKEDGAPALESRQRLLSRRRAEASRERLLSLLEEPKARARLRACGGTGAGAWLLAAPTSPKTRLSDSEFQVALRLRLRVPFRGSSNPGRCCRNQRRGGPGEDVASGPGSAECRQHLDEDGFHALTCLVGGLVLRRHHNLRDLYAAVGAEAGYTSSTEVHEPSWTRARQNAAGEWEVEQARLDNRFDGPPEDPLTYGDVVVSHPEASAWLGAAANTDGATAASAARGKHSRYPAWALPGGRLVAFSVETFGRWDAEA